MYSRAVVSSKGQVVIPKFLREELGIHSGMELVFEIRAHNTLSVTPTQRNISMLSGCCKDPSSKTKISVEQMDRDIMRAVIKNNKQGSL